MKIINDAQQRVQQFVEENSTTLLTAGGVVGTVATGVLSFRAGCKYQKLAWTKDEHNRFESLDENNPDPPTYQPLSTTDKVKLGAVHVVPPVIAGSATIASIILAHRMSAQKAAALAAAYGLSQKHFEEYRDKVQEKLTGPKAQAIDDELAQDRVNRTPGANQVVILDSESEVLCFDQATGRYFKSSMEKINRAVNATNAEINGHDFVAASYFYDELELPPTTWSDEVGWNRHNKCELVFSTVMSPNEKPCIAFDFKKLPTEDYMRGS